MISLLQNAAIDPALLPVRDRLHAMLQRADALRAKSADKKEAATKEDAIAAIQRDVQSLENEWRAADSGVWRPPQSTAAASATVVLEGTSSLLSFRNGLKFTLSTEF